MVTLEALSKKRSMHYVPDAYKKYGESIGAESLKEIKKLHFEMLEPPIIRRTPLPEEKQPLGPDGERQLRDDGSLVVYYKDTAYIPIRIDGADKILITPSVDMIKQFYGIDFDELDDPQEAGCLLRFYQDKIDGGLTLKWIEHSTKEGKKFDAPILEADE